MSASAYGASTVHKLGQHQQLSIIFSQCYTFNLQHHVILPKSDGKYV